jgi:hypothetical protein
MKGGDVAYWPLTSFTALQKCGRYRINSGHTVPSGLIGSVANDPKPTWAGLFCCDAQPCSRPTIC